MKAPALLLALVSLVPAGGSFAATPAPRPSASDVEAWGRVIDTVFTPERMKGVPLSKTLALTGTAALGEGKPALAEACFRRVFAAEPGLEAQSGDIYLRAALELSRDAGKKAALAPFILLYLDLAEAKGSAAIASLGGEVKALRSELASVKSPPPARESPSVASLREVAAAAERRTRAELARAKYRRTAGDLRVLGTAFEAYAVDRSRYPAGDLAAIEKQLSPTYVRAFPRLDAWGNPYRVETSADRQHYRIVSAGEDGSFDALPRLGTAAGSAKRTVDDAARDIVFEDGQLVQEWSETAFERAADAALAAPRPPLDAATLAERVAARDTMASIRIIATAMEAYRIDKDSYPAGWLETIERALVPTYLREFPRLDAWGTPFRIKTSGQMKHVRIVSAGADGVFEPIPYLDPETRPAARKVTDPARDLVFEDGDFVQQPEMDPASGAGKRVSRPAPEPTPAEVAAWGPILDAAFPPPPKPGPETVETVRALGSLASAARRACVPALSEAIWRRTLGEKPEARRSAAGAVFADAWALYLDAPRWGETAPFILLYLEQAQRLRSTEIMDREDVVAIARARLLAVDAAPRPRPSPSAEGLRRIREASPTRTGPAATPEDDARSAHGRTLAEIRRVGDALAQYRSDQGNYPNVGNRLVEGTIPGVYIAKVPTRDAWGTEFRVSWSPDRKHFRIVSAGSDREFEKSGPVDPLAAWGPTTLSADPRSDVVFQDGVFLQAYRDSR